jgi:hypothetical protein
MGAITLTNTRVYKNRLRGDSITIKLGKHAEEVKIMLGGTKHLRVNLTLEHVTGERVSDEFCNKILKQTTTIILENIVVFIDKYNRMLVNDYFDDDKLLKLIQNRTYWKVTIEALI